MKLVPLAIGLALIASGAAAESYGLKAAKAALSGRSAAVIVAVPTDFVHVGKPMAGDAAVAGDWQFFFNEWVKRHGARSNVVVVTPAELKSLVRMPALNGRCTTLWLRDRTHALVYDATCAPTADIYNAGDTWLRTGEAPAAAALRPIQVRLR